MGMMTAVGPVSIPFPLSTRMKGKGKGKGVRPVLWGLSIHRMGYGYWKGSDDCGSRKRTLKSAHLVPQSWFEQENGVWKGTPLSHHFASFLFLLVVCSSNSLSPRQARFTLQGSALRCIKVWLTSYVWSNPIEL